MASLILVVEAKIKTTKHSKSSQSITIRKALKCKDFAHKLCCFSLGKLFLYSAMLLLSLVTYY